MLISDWSSDVCSSDLSSCRRHCGPPIRSHYGRAPTRVVRCTYIGRMGTGLGSRYQQMLAAPAAAARKANLGELAIQEAMNDFALDQAQKTGGFLFEDHKIAHASFLVPDNCRKKIGRAHVCTPVTTAPLVCRLLLEKKK